MTTFLFLRHGETEWNRLGKYTGQTDIPLTEVGKEQALSVREKIAKLGVTAAYSSDLQRAVDTARYALSLTTNIPFQVDPRLREIHQGEWEGLHVDDIKARYAKEFENRKSDPIRVAPPGGESVGEVKNRVIEALSEIEEQHQKDARILISSHGLSIAVARVTFGNIPIDEVWEYIPANAEIITIERSGAF